MRLLWTRWTAWEGPGTHWERDFVILVLQKYQLFDAVPGVTGHGSQVTGHRSQVKFKQLVPSTTLDRVLGWGPNWCSEVSNGPKCAKQKAHTDP